MTYSRLWFFYFICSRIFLMSWGIYSVRNLLKVISSWDFFALIVMTSCSESWIRLTSLVPNMYLHSLNLINGKASYLKVLTRATTLWCRVTYDNLLFPPGLFDQTVLCVLSLTFTRKKIGSASDFDDADDVFNSGLKAYSYSLFFITTERNLIY